MRALLNHFKSLGDDMESGNSFDPRNCEIPENTLINKPFTKKEVLDVIKKLKNNKACGIDNIINEFLKSCPVVIYDILLMFFNIILNTGIIPSVWSVSLIQPIYKGKGSLDDPDNYRGISLISCLGKMFTALINNRLTMYLDASNILGEEQAGFREKYSTSDHIFVLNTLINIYQTKNRQIYCAFVDYRKAFDFINRSNLWGKLLESGINGKIINVIYNIYENSKACVKKDKNISPSFTNDLGIRQGDNLSPLMFALYLNDFKQFLSMRYDGLKLCENLAREFIDYEEARVFLRMYVLLYADDTIILAESPKELQKALDALYDYCKVWNLKVNISKTNIVIFSRGKIQIYPIFKYGDQTIDVVENYTYLGTIMNYNGKYSKAIEKQISQANRAVFSLRAKQAKFKLPLDILFNLFDALVIPILLYGSEIWGYEKMANVDVFYKKCLKNTLRLNQQTPDCMVFGETGRYPISYYVNQKMINFWHRIATGKDSKLSNIFYRLSRSMHDRGEMHSPWLAHIKKVLCECGMANVWNYPNTINSNWLKNAIQLRLSDIFKQDWHAKMYDMSSCLNYRLFKIDHKFEHYLDILDPFNRISFTRYRCGNSKIPVVLGRYINRPIDECICHLCNSTDIGDEYHYIMKCKFFETDRRNLVPLYYLRSPNTTMFELLFSTENRNILNKLSKFISIILAKFK